jgi:hypothetical protein
MWFAEQFNSFLNLGICKEYPIMAKAKAPVTKAKRGSKEAVVTNNPETVLDPVVAPVPASVQPEPTINAEVKASPDVQVGAESKTKVEPKLDAQPKTDAQPKAENKVDSEAKGNSDSKIFEVRKADGRKNLIPINLEDEIRRRAYELSQQRQPGSGGAADDWLAAEREVMQRYHQQSA